MSIEWRGEVYYLIMELAELCAEPIEDLTAAAERLGVLASVENGFPSIARRALPAFFDAYFEGRRYELTYRQPSWLRNSAEPWCRALSAAYDDPISRPTSVSPQQGEFLRSLVANSNPSHMVEIGTFLGVSTLWIASALKDAGRGGLLHSIDLFEDVLPLRNKTRTRCVVNPVDVARSRVLEAGLADHVRLIESESKIAGANWSAYLREPIDILYIDGDHSKRGCLGDFEAFLPHLREDGFLIFHDVFPENCGCDGPRFLLDRMAALPGAGIFELETSPHNFGMAVLRLGKVRKPRREVLD